jgi:AraC-like DNA-binding protein
MSEAPTIIIVEDEFIIARDIKRILTEEGYHCISNIATYDEAIQAISTHNTQLVIIDIMLRKTHDGLRIGNYLYQKGTIPYVYLTSLHDKNTVHEIKQTFPHGYIVKPFKPIDVITNVSLALNNFRHIKVDINRVSAPTIEDDVPFQIKKVLVFIHDNITEKIVLDDLVSQTRWKKHNFIKLFTQYVNTTPHQYVLKTKIEKCMAMMETTDLSVNDIAFELGFSSYSNFSKLFKSVVGTTVEEYKRKLRLAKTQSE